MQFPGSEVKPCPYASHDTTSPEAMGGYSFGQLFLTASRKAHFLTVFGLTATSAGQCYQRPTNCSCYGLPWAAWLTSFGGVWVGAGVQSAQGGDEDEDGEDSEADKKLTADEQAAKKEKHKMDELFRELSRTKVRLTHQSSQEGQQR